MDAMTKDKFIRAFKITIAKQLPAIQEPGIQTKSMHIQIERYLDVENYLSTLGGEVLVEFFYERLAIMVYEARQEFGSVDEIAIAQRALEATLRYKQSFEIKGV